MKKYKFLDSKGTFYLEQPENNSYLYFPIAGEQGIKGAVTPSLSGDLKLGQNQFILEPVSSENLHNNKSTRNFWLRQNNGSVWSATGVSAEQNSKRFTEEQEESTLEAGIMWHRMSRTSQSGALKSVITSFVPLSESQVEIMLVEITNEGEEAITFTPTAAIPIYGRSADNIRDHRHVTSLLHQIKTNDYGVLVTPTLSFDERGHQQNHVTYFVCGVTGQGEKPEGFYPITEKYIGEGGSFERPEAIVRKLDSKKSGFEINGYEAMGGIQFEEITLNRKESKTYTLLLGTCENSQNVEEIVSEFDALDKVLKHMEEMKAYWDVKCNVNYQTADKEFDQLMYWVNFQPILRRIYGCSFLPHHDYGKGGRGWRDLWQDCLALLIMDPKGVRELLVNNYAGVRIDGTNATIIGSAPGEFIADRNNITRVWMDHGVWPLITTKLYIDQTGDISILLQEVGYFKDKQALRGTAIDTEWNNQGAPVLRDLDEKEYKGSILEHLLLQNLTAFYEVGEHNHLRLRGADWNDALDMAPGRGESVAFTAAYADNLDSLAKLILTLKESTGRSELSIAKEMEILLQDSVELYKNAEQKRELLGQYGKSCFHAVSGEKISISIEQLIESLKNKASWIKQHIRENEWISDTDGDGWFNGYYDNHGRRLEGCFDSGERMMLTSQVFTIMSGTASEEQVKAITASADRYLYQENMGGYKLNTDFKEVKLDMGRMFGFAYGHKENGAVFSHMTIMYANALYGRGFVKEGFKAISSLYRQALNFERSRIYPGIPEYFNSEGRGMYHYLTGSASWMMLTVIQEMFGVKGRMGHLAFEPKLLLEQFDETAKAQLELTFQDRNWKVCYVNEGHLEYGDYKINGIALNGQELEIIEDQAMISVEIIEGLSKEGSHEVIVTLGK